MLVRDQNLLDVVGMIQEKHVERAEPDVHDRRHIRRSTATETPADRAESREGCRGADFRAAQVETHENLTLRRRQFQQAAGSLNALPFPKVVVPGNHDVPMFNLAARFIDPLRGFRRWIGADVEPTYRDAGFRRCGCRSFSRRAGNGHRTIQLADRQPEFRPVVCRSVQAHAPGMDGMRVAGV